MRPKHYPYKDIDGNHFPDAALGSAEYYCINFGDWIREENDELVTAEWIVPDQLDNLDNYVASREAYIKLGTKIRGSFRVELKLTTQENGNEQTRVVPMILRVY